MTEIKTYCDHCKRLLDDMKDYVGAEIEMAHLSKEFDLCTDCFEMLWDYINDFC